MPRQIISQPPIVVPVACTHQIGFKHRLVGPDETEHTFTRSLIELAVPPTLRRKFISRRLCPNCGQRLLLIVTGVPGSDWSRCAVRVENEHGANLHPHYGITGTGVTNVISRKGGQWFGGEIQTRSPTSDYEAGRVSTVDLRQFDRCNPELFSEEGYLLRPLNCNDIPSLSLDELSIAMVECPRDAVLALSQVEDAPKRVKQLIEHLSECRRRLERASTLADEMLDSRPNKEELLEAVRPCLQQVPPSLVLALLGDGLFARTVIAAVLGTGTAVLLGYLHLAMGGALPLRQWMVVFVFPALAGVVYLVGVLLDWRIAAPAMRMAMPKLLLFLGLAWIVVLAELVGFVVRWLG